MGQAVIRSLVELRILGRAAEPVLHTAIRFVVDALADLVKVDVRRKAIARSGRSSNSRITIGQGTRIER
jgi:hypothetical protein